MKSNELEIPRGWDLPNSYRAGTVASRFSLVRENFQLAYLRGSSGNVLTVDDNGYVVMTYVSGIDTEGFSGYSGFSGKNGINGASGFSGYSGYSFSGFSGWSGYSGLTGNSGFSGFSGFSGINGTNGTHGASGFSGYSGQPGISGFSGFSGFPGEQGLSGQSGWSGFSGQNGINYSDSTVYIAAPSATINLTPSSATNQFVNASSDTTIYLSPTSTSSGKRFTITHTGATNSVSVITVRDYETSGYIAGVIAKSAGKSFFCDGTTWRTNDYLYNIGIGDSAINNQSFGIGMGSNAYNNYFYGIGIGTGTQNNYSGGIGMGYNASNNFYYGIGLGYGAFSNYSGGIGIGSGAKENSFYGIGIGFGASGNMSGSIGIGLSARTRNKLSSIAIGDNAHVFNDYAIGIGKNTYVTRKGDVCFGFDINNTQGKYLNGFSRMSANITTNSATELFLLDGSTRLVIPEGTAYSFDAQVQMVSNTKDTYKKWAIDGVISRPVGGNVVMGVTVIQVKSEYPPNVGYALSVTADTTNQCLKLTATSASGATNNCVATAVFNMNEVRS